MYYTAQELSDILINEQYSEMTVRKIRYYSQIGILSPPELVNGKKKYTEKHLDELRATKTMQKAGAKLGEIRGMIQQFDEQQLSSISEQMNYISKDRLGETFIEYIDEDVSIIFSNAISQTKKEAVISALKALSTEEE